MRFVDTAPLPSPSIRSIRKIKREVRLPLIWLAIVGSTAVGLFPLASAPVIHDDLIDLLSGLALLEGSGPLEFIAQAWNGALSTDHLTPVGIILGLLQLEIVWLAALTAKVEPSTTWRLLRIAWILVTLLTASWSLNSWVGDRALARIKRSLRLPLCLAIMSVLVVATLQVQPAWLGTSPAVAYPVASWASTAIAFSYLAMLGRTLLTDEPRARQALFTGMLGCFAVLSYPLAFAILTPALVLAAAALTYASAARLRIGPIAKSIGPPMLLLLGYTVLSVLRTSGYSGTEAGSALIALKVLPARVASSLPIISTQDGWLNWQPFSITALLAPIGVSLVLVVVMSMLHQPGPPDFPPIGSNRRIPLSIYAVAMAAYWLAATTLIAASARYQSELGTTTTFVHTYYAPSTICIASVLTLLGIRLALNQGDRLSTAAKVTVVSLVCFAFLQGQVNAREIAALQGRFVSNTRLLVGVESAVMPVIDRCLAARAFNIAAYPDYYRQSALTAAASLRSITAGDELCPGLVMANASPVMVEILGATHGPEVTPTEQFWWNDSPGVRLILRRSPFADGRDTARIALLGPPCLTGQVVEIDGPTSTIQLTLTSDPTFLELPVPSSSDQKVVYTVTANRPGCRLPGDPRTLGFRIGYPPIPLSLLHGST